MIRTFLGEMNADQAHALSIALQSAGPVAPEDLMQARAPDGAWALWHIRLDGRFAHICDGAQRWPGVRHDQRCDAASWPGKAIEEDDARLRESARPSTFQPRYTEAAAAELQRLFEQGGPDQSNVTPLRPNGVVAGGYPVPEVVEYLERYLEQAKRGEISAIALAGVRPSHATFVDWAAGTAPANLMMAAVHLLDHWLMKVSLAAMDEEEG